VSVNASAMDLGTETPVVPKTARGVPGGLLTPPKPDIAPSGATLPGPDPTLLPPLPRTRVNHPNPTPFPPKPRSRERRKASLALTESEWHLLRTQAERWAGRQILTSTKGGRPAYLSAYVGWLVRERERLSALPRAVSGRESGRRVRFARAIAPWSPRPHRYDGPPKVPRSELCLHRSLVAEFPKDGDDACRKKALQALQFGVVSAVEAGDLLEPTSISVSEVGRLQYLKPADAIRFCSNRNDGRDRN
jgi:hypothetical protein